MKTDMPIQEQISLCIKARCPIIYITSTDERRVCITIEQICNQLEMACVQWTMTQGITKISGEIVSAETIDPQKILGTIATSKKRMAYILKDYHPFIDPQNPINTPNIRMLRDLSAILRNTPVASARTVFILSPKLAIPEELQSDIVVLNWPLPTRTELNEAAKLIVEKNNCKVDEKTISLAATSATGLTLAEATNCFSKSLVANKTLDIKIITAEKKQIVARGGILEWIEPEGGLEVIGGLNNLKDWLVKRKDFFSDEARAYGLPAPKGILLVGVPGCGKSLTAKVVGIAWQVPVVRMDAGRLFGKYIGESEGLVRRALELAEAISPCVLWLDELEKALSGINSSGETDGGTTSRVFNTILTWMQEKKSEVFLFATANDISKLPPELLRKGRLDEIFYVDLPTPEEREKIWSIHLNKRKQTLSTEDVGELVKNSEGMSGAEIEAVIIDAMYNSFAERRALQKADILIAIQKTTPLSKTMAEKIEQIREWAKTRARPASNYKDMSVADGVAELDLG